MRRASMILLTVAALVALAHSARAQSLADAARKNRMNKPATPASHVYTNDNLPTRGALSITGPAPAEPPSSAESARSAAAAERSSQAEAKEKEARDKLEKEWRERFKKQRDAITLVEREDAALDREIKLRPQGVACATTNLCNDKTAKDQQVQQEKQKLEDMKDELRKAGLPDSWAE